MSCRDPDRADHVPSGWHRAFVRCFRGAAKSERLRSRSCDYTPFHRISVIFHLILQESWGVYVHVQACVRVCVCLILVSGSKDFGHLLAPASCRKAPRLWALNMSFV